MPRPSRPLSRYGLAGLRLVGHPRVELVPRHHVPLVMALPDHIKAVMRLDVEADPLAIDRCAFDIDRYGKAGRRRRAVAHVDMHAEAALALIEMRLHQLD